MKKMYRLSQIIASIILISFFSSCSSTPYVNFPQIQMIKKLQAGGTPLSSSQSNQQPQQASQPASAYWTGDGGKGRSITILPPRPIGLTEDVAYLPDLVASGLVDNFRTYSAMTLFDRVTNERQYNELLSGFYADDDLAGQDLGKLVSTDFMLLGTITKTSTGYMLQMTINRNLDKTTIATHTASTSIVELDGLISVQRASLDLLQKMGIQLTAAARTELNRAAAVDQVNALTSMAQGINAQRRGDEVLALSYFFQAAAFDASLTEAVSRTNVLSANISTGNIGSDVRNDFAWHDDWRAKLTETETLMGNILKNTNPQRSIWYSNNVTEHEAARDHMRRTTELRIEAALHTHAVFPVSVQRTVQAVYDGLQSTKRAQAWNLNNWPRQGVTNSNPFNSRWGSRISIVFEVLNEHGLVIGQQTAAMDSNFSFNGTRLEGPGTAYTTVRFTGVRGDDIHYPLAIRVASINGQTPGESGITRIEPMATSNIQANKNHTIYNGAIRPSTNNRNLGVVTIPSVLWDERVTAIANGAYERSGVTSVTIQNSISDIGANAFANNQLSSITIPSSVKTIGANAFANNRLTSVNIHEGVITIGEKAFAGNYWTTNERYSDGSSYTEYHGLKKIKIPNSVTSIGQEAFFVQWTTHHYSDGRSYTINHTLVTEVTIGADVKFGTNAIGGGFEAAYSKEGKKAGVYKRFNSSSTSWTIYENAEQMRSAVVTGNTLLYIIGGVALVGLLVWAYVNRDSTESEEGMIRRYY